VVAHARGAIKAYGFRDRLRTGDTYGLLLALILFGFVVLAAVEDTPESQVVISTVLGGIVVLALHTSHVGRRLKRFTIVVAVLCIAASCISALAGVTGAFRIAGYLIFALMLVAPIMIVARIVSDPVVDLETISGALCAYLMIGILFSGLCRGLQIVTEQPFFVQNAHPSPIQFLYFSFVTMTTLGYGDLTPAHDSGRLLVIFEAVIGQVFLVTIVASLVSNFEGRRVLQAEARAAEDEAQR
jgi:hypothetical protein